MELAGTDSELGTPVAFLKHSGEEGLGTLKIRLVMIVGNSFQ